MAKKPLQFYRYWKCINHTGARHGLHISLGPNGAGRTFSSSWVFRVIVKISNKEYGAGISYVVWD